MVVVDSKTKRLKALHAKMEGEGFFSDMVAKVKQYINPKLTSQGIYSTDVGIDRKSSVRQPLENQSQMQTPQQPEKQGYFSTLLYGRNDFPPAARAILKAHGEKRITKAVVIRQPVMSFNTKLLNFVSFGAFQESLDKQPYDTLFHLRSVFTLEDGTRVQVEKSEVIHIDTKITVVKGQQEKEVELPQEPMTINKFLEGAKKILKGNMYSYDGFKNNCQDFQIAMYRGADLLTPELEAFIKQDVSEIAESSPIISKAANLVTGLGGKFNELIHGAGINKKYNKTHLVQSVVFDKKKWKLKDAVKWLEENNYHSPKVDITTKTMRFRQIDPTPYKSPDWKYTTHRLGNGIDLVILYRMTGNEHPIETPKGLSKGQKQHLLTGNGLSGNGDLIHIDLGSHNASGKAKLKMEGEGIAHGEGIIDTIIEFVKSLSKRNQPEMMQEVQTRQTIKDKKDQDRFKIWRQLYGEAMKGQGIVPFSGHFEKNTNPVKYGKPVMGMRPSVMKGGAISDAQMNNIMQLGLDDADLDRILNQAVNQHNPPVAAGAAAALAQPVAAKHNDNFASQYMQLKMLKNATKYHAPVQPPKRKYTKKTDAEKIKIAKAKLKLKLLKEALKKKPTKKKPAKRKIKGGVLGHTGTEDNAQFNPITGLMEYTSHSLNPMKSYNPLDMKISTQNVMLNNLKKSDLQDLDRLKTEVKRSNYDREATIQKIKGITKSRVKKEVKAVKTAKPRNIKTRGSLESKKALLEKMMKSKRKYVKKVKA